MSQKYSKESAQTKLVLICQNWVFKRITLVKSRILMLLWMCKKVILYTYAIRFLYTTYLINNHCPILSPIYVIKYNVYFCTEVV